MKKILFLLFALCPLFYVLQVEAQIDTTKFQVHNYKYHVLMHDGLEMNVVDVSLDWPDSIDGNDCLPLRQYLSRTLGTVGTTADTVIRQQAMASLSADCWTPFPTTIAFAMPPIR